VAIVCIVCLHPSASCGQIADGQIAEQHGTSTIGCEDASGVDSAEVVLSVIAGHYSPFGREEKRGFRLSSQSRHFPYWAIHPRAATTIAILGGDRILRPVPLSPSQQLQDLHHPVANVRPIAVVCRSSASYQIFKQHLRWWTGFSHREVHCFGFLCCYSQRSLSAPRSRSYPIPACDVDFISSSS